MSIPIRIISLAVAVSVCLSLGPMSGPIAQNVPGADENPDSQPGMPYTPEYDRRAYDPRNDDMRFPGAPRTARINDPDYEDVRLFNTEAANDVAGLLTLLREAITRCDRVIYESHLSALRTYQRIGFELRFDPYADPKVALKPGATQADIDKLRANYIKMSANGRGAQRGSGAIDFGLADSTYDAWQKLEFDLIRVRRVMPPPYPEDCRMGASSPAIDPCLHGRWWDREKLIMITFAPDGKHRAFYSEMKPLKGSNQEFGFRGTAIGYIKVANNVAEIKSIERSTVTLRLAVRGAPEVVWNLSDRMGPGALGEAGTGTPYKCDSESRELTFMGTTHRDRRPNFPLKYIRD